MIQLRHCTLEFTPDGAVTRFPDGSEIGACPHPGNPHYTVVAHQLGYGDDLLWYCRDHEASHSFIEQELHDRPSRVLWALAHGSCLSGRDAAYEEIAAQVFQGWVRANRRPIIGGLPWDRMKAEFLELVDGHDHV